MARFYADGMRKWFGWIITALGGLVWLLDKIGTFQTAQGLVENRSSEMKLLVAIATSQWLPLGIFVLGVALLVCTHLDIPFWPQQRATLSPFSTKISRSGINCRLLIGVKNTTDIPAFDPQSTIVIWRCSGERAPILLLKSTANPIIKETLEQVELDFTIDPVEPIFVVIYFAHRSRERGKLREQNLRFYFRWNDFDSTLTHASHEERETIVKRLKQFEKGRRREFLVKASGVVAETSDYRTPIEVVDDLILEATRLEEVCSDFSEGCKERVDTFTNIARAYLRKCASEYVAAFNDAVQDPQPRTFFPIKARTATELGRWLEDKDRENAWRVISTCGDRLKQIRSNLRSKLPL